MTRPPALTLLAVALLLAAAGCARRPPAHTAETPKASPVLIELTKPSTFEVDDNEGNRVMDATADRAGGTITPGPGKGAQAVGNGPVTMTAPNCLMYKTGKPDMRIRAARAVWKDGVLNAEGGVHLETLDGSLKADCDHANWKNEVVTMFRTSALLSQSSQPKMKITAPQAMLRGDQLIADQTAHSETPDGTMKLDAQHAIWNRATGHLLLIHATGGQFEAGKQTVAAEGPRADYQNDWLTLPATGMARRLDDGSSVRAEKVRWNRVTAQAMADGNVRLQTPDMWIEGQHFVGNTNLKKGRLTGGRPRMRFLRRKPAHPA